MCQASALSLNPLSSYNRSHVRSTCSGPGPALTILRCHTSATPYADSAPLVMASSWGQRLGYGTR